MDEFVVNKKVGRGLGAIVVVSILFMLILIKSIVIIPPGSVGIVIFFGKVRENALRNGIHLINPLANVIKMSVRTEEYTMSVATAEGHIRGDDAIDALTKILEVNST